MRGRATIRADPPLGSLPGAQVCPLCAESDSREARPRAGGWWLPPPTTAPGSPAPSLTETPGLVLFHLGPKGGRNVLAARPLRHPAASLLAYGSPGDTPVGGRLTDWLVGAGTCAGRGEALHVRRAGFTQPLPCRPCLHRAPAIVPVPLPAASLPALGAGSTSRGGPILQAHLAGSGWARARPTGTEVTGASTSLMSPPSRAG